MDFYNSLLKIKSGKDYTAHSAISKFLTNKDYNVKKGYVLSKEHKIWEKDNIIFFPIYMIMFF